MEEYIENLRKLQSVDIRIREIRDGLEKYPSEIGELKEDLRNRRESIELKESRVEELRSERKSLESSLGLNLDSIKKSEARLFEIKTHKEYEAIQKEITQTKKENLEIEDRTISIMEETEETEKLLGEEKTAYSALEEEYGGKITEKERKIEELEVSRKPVEKEKSDLASRIDPKILPVYERILQRNGRALALAENEKCNQLQHKHPSPAFQRDTQAHQADPVSELQENPVHQLKPALRTENMAPAKNTEVYVDGASRGNPGESGIGVLVIREDGTRREIRKYLGQGNQQRGGNTGP